MFIQLNEDLSINVGSIEAIEEINELTCMVYTSRHSFKVKLPKNAVIQLIERKQKSSPSVEMLLKQIYEGQQSPRV